jgi:hypothetical protein
MIPVIASYVRVISFNAIVTPHSIDCLTCNHRTISLPDTIRFRQCGVKDRISGIWMQQNRHGKRLFERKKGISS